MVGVGLTPEGIETNYVVYDLMLEMGWRTEQIELTTWIDNYTERRYAGISSDVTSAWNAMVNTVYKDVNGIGRHCRGIPIMKPSFHLQPDIWYNEKDFLKAWDFMVNGAPLTTDTSTFR